MLYQLNLFSKQVGNQVKLFAFIPSIDPFDYESSDEGCVVSYATPAHFHTRLERVKLASDFKALIEQAALRAIQHIDQLFVVHDVSLGFDQLFTLGFTALAEKLMGVTAPKL